MNKLDIGHLTVAVTALQENQSTLRDWLDGQGFLAPDVAREAARIQLQQHEEALAYFQAYIRNYTDQ